jgi:hypothetical protein
MKRKPPPHVGRSSAPTNGQPSPQSSGLSRREGETDEAFATRSAKYDERLKASRALRALPIGKRKAIELRKRAEALAAAAAEVKTWPPCPDIAVQSLAAAIDAAIATVHGVADRLAELPDDYGRGISHKTGELTAGTSVRIREERRSTYAGIAGMLSTLEVIQHMRPLVLVKTITGAQMAIPRAHLEIGGV